MGLKSLIEGHPFTAMFLAVTVLFLSGYFDAAILKQRAWACATWFLGLMILTGSIAHPPTIVRSCLGVIVFAFGITLMTIYYKRQAPRKVGKS